MTTEATIETEDMSLIFNYGLFSNNFFPSPLFFNTDKPVNQIDLGQTFFVLQYTQEIPIRVLNCVNIHIILKQVPY